MSADSRLRSGDIDEPPENRLVDSLEGLAARLTEPESGGLDIDEAELNEILELPEADLSSMSGEDLTMPVVPQQDDEFTCSVCFLVHHRSRLARVGSTTAICRDCAQR